VFGHLKQDIQEKIIGIQDTRKLEIISEVQMWHKFTNAVVFMVRVLNRLLRGQGFKSLFSLTVFRVYVCSSQKQLELHS